jgi:hypothetical protein
VRFPPTPFRRPDPPGSRLPLRRTAIATRGDNLADVLYRDASSRIKDFAPNPGRNISFLYRVSF